MLEHNIMFRALTGALLLAATIITPALAVNPEEDKAGYEVQTITLDQSLALTAARTELLVDPGPMTLAAEEEAAMQREQAEEGPQDQKEQETINYTASTGSLIWPAEGVLTSPFGQRWGRTHEGIDISSRKDSPIYAADGGLVTYAGNKSNGYGNIVVISHDNGTETWYAHCNTLLVAEGERVAQGQQIATMGSTGYSTGVHLHFEVHVGGEPCDPVSYLP
ncbi:MAG: M23 family metallopeptidase [Oscillospiraceae bacterium]